MEAMMAGEVDSRKVVELAFNVQQQFRVTE
jgi:hypothetical protein